MLSLQLVHFPELQCFPQLDIKKQFWCEAKSPTPFLNTNLLGDRSLGILDKSFNSISSVCNGIFGLFCYWFLSNGLSVADNSRNLNTIGEEQEEVYGGKPDLSLD